MDGGASSPAMTTPSGFYWKPAASGRKIRKETIFLPGKWDFPPEKSLRPRRTRRRVRFPEAYEERAFHTGRSFSVPVLGNKKERFG